MARPPKRMHGTPSAQSSLSEELPDGKYPSPVMTQGAELGMSLSQPIGTFPQPGRIGWSRTGLISPWGAGLERGSDARPGVRPWTDTEGLGVG